MSALLIHEPPLQVLPSLAVEIGLNEAIVLQQIHYWLQRSTTKINGCAWVYNTVLQWREQFPFWSDDTISRTLKSLRERGIVVAEKLSENPFDKTLFYRIDYSKIPAPKTADCGDQNTASCGDRKPLDAGISSTETTTEKAETTNRKAPRGRGAKADVSAFVPPDWLDLEAWVGFEEMRRKIKKPLTDHARALAIKALQELEDKGHKHADVLNQSTLNSWQGLFPVKDAQANGRQGAKPQALHNGLDQIDYGQGIRRL